MAKTAIEWTDYSWNPIRARNRATGNVGWFCTHASPGCAGCYAERMNQRLGNGVPFKAQHVGDVEIYLDEKKQAGRLLNGVEHNARPEAAR